jgi:hypothetical protein
VSVLDPHGPYVCEALYPEWAGRTGADADGWMVITDGGRDWCLGFMEARKDMAPRPAYRVRKLGHAENLRELHALDTPSLGMIAGWPTAEQLRDAAIRVLRPLAEGTYGPRRKDVDPEEMERAAAALRVLEAPMAPKPDPERVAEFQALMDEGEALRKEYERISASMRVSSRNP